MSVELLDVILLVEDSRHAGRGGGVPSLQAELGRSVPTAHTESVGANLKIFFKKNI